MASSITSTKKGFVNPKASSPRVGVVIFHLTPLDELEHTNSLVSEHVRVVYL
jgi:hypothetical protein